MKKLLYSFLLLSSAALVAQQKASPKFAIADHAIGTVDMFNAKKSSVQVLKVYGTLASLPQNLKKYSKLFTKGVTEYKFKDGKNIFDTMSLAEINTQHGISQDTSVFIDGVEFNDTTTLIYPQIKKKTEEKMHNGKKTLFISTTE
ncbi:hypothetical protein [Chryseobacterium sp. Mn2064]|uniref:hypothetical protein n=1 Tax=Chryseobacterium sp. Mn2064 TaxID=3395263 RepID=UPI003BCD69F4